MDLSPLVTAPSAVQWHVATILSARGHQVMTLFICIASIGIAGALTFLPGRIMQQLFFGS